MAGLLAARALSIHFAQVTVVERDELIDDASPRKGVPQGRHAHALLCRGQQIMADYFPGLFDELEAEGAQRIDMGAQAAWLHFGVWKARHPSGLTSYYQTRPFLESRVLRRVKRLPNVRFIRGDVVSLLSGSQGAVVSGVRVRARGVADTDASESDITANLVVDTSGRGSHTPVWLQSLGYAPPRETAVRIDGGYATRIYRRPQGVPSDRQVMILYPRPPHTARIGYIFPIEGERWLVTLGSRLADYPPVDPEGYLEYARSLDAPDLYESIRTAEPLSEIVGNRYKANLWRHYEALRRFPEGLVVLGDALCSFNPAYGQGMTVCALEVRALDECLSRQSGRVIGLANRFRRKAGRLVAMPWLLATSEDFRYSRTQGRRPFYMRALTWYTAKMHRRCAKDPVVYEAFLRVMQMMSPPASLFQPSMLWRVLGPVVEPSKPERDIAPQGVSFDSEAR
jgi:2-polyprenyl-6-methoxyphenol hydroxylase-like FAD-dependent oxidoreductase